MSAVLGSAGECAGGRCVGAFGGFGATIEKTEEFAAAFKAARRIHRGLEADLVAQVGPRKVAALRDALAAIIESSDVDPADRVLRPL